MSQKTFFKGILPANNMPLHEDHSIDEEALKKHISWLASFDGIKGIVCNVHAGEVELLTREERRRVIQITKDGVKKRIPVISGICAWSQTEAIQYAKDAKEEGVDGIMVPPLPQFGQGADWEIPYHYLKAIDKAVNLPIIVFQYGENTGCDYSPETLVKLCEIDNVVAIEDASSHFEADFIAVSDLPRKVAMLSPKGNLFLTRFMISDGSVSSFANVIPYEIATLYKLVKGGQFEKAKQLNRRISPLVKAIYHEPRLQHWVREKEALVARGRFPWGTMRPPYLPLTKKEKHVIWDAVKRVEPQG